MTIKSLFATQGGGTAIYDELQKSYVFHVVPKWATCESPGDRVPESWSVQNIGWVSNDPIEEMTSAERDGYEVGYSGKADNANRYIETSFFHQEWKAGYERGCAERFAMDVIPTTFKKEEVAADDNEE